jgi:hypothetical protein
MLCWVSLGLGVDSICHFHSRCSCICFILAEEVQVLLRTFQDAQGEDVSIRSFNVSVLVALLIGIEALCQLFLGM